LLNRFSTDTFSGVLEQLSKSDGGSGAIPIVGNDPTSEPVVDFTTCESLKERPRFLPEEVEDQVDSQPDVSRIERDVTEAIESILAAQNIWDPTQDPARLSLDDQTLTPAQRFYLENKELLVKRASEYSVSKAMNEWEKEAKDVEDEWAFYRDPVVRPSRGKLWPVSPQEKDEPQAETSSQAWSNDFPSIEELVAFLRAEHVEDIAVIDMEEAGRRDIGEYALVGTVRSYAHGSRVGGLARKSVVQLRLENVTCSTDSTPGQEWIVVRLGPVVVHLMTPQERARFQLEDLYRSDLGMSEETSESLEELSSSEIMGDSDSILSLPVRLHS
jgi:ribosomal silencing factor RsfS